MIYYLPFVSQFLLVAIGEESINCSVLEFGSVMDSILLLCFYEANIKFHEMFLLSSFHSPSCNKYLSH